MTTTMPRVSTIITCHHDAAWVGRAVESALAQRYPDHEILVVDDGSTDDTLDVLARHEGRIRILAQPRRGPAAARNLGIAHATGEFVAFLDADDWLLPDGHARRAAVLDRDTGAGLVYGDAIVQDVRGRRLGRSLPRRFRPDRYLVALFLLRADWNPTMAMARRAVLDQVGGFDEDLPVSEDWELWMRIAAASRVRSVRQPVAVRSNRPGSLGKRRDLFSLAQPQITEKIIGLIPALAPLRRRREAAIEVSEGWLDLFDPDFDAAIRRFRAALELDRRNLTAWRLLAGTAIRRAVARPAMASR